MSAKSRRLTAIVAAVAAATLVTAGCGTSSANAKNAKNFTLTITANAIAGGKNSDGAKWITDWVIPRFEAAEKAKGLTAKVQFIPSGAADEDYKTKLALDLRSKSAADIMGIDGIWVGEFAQAGYIKPLSQVVGAAATNWDGWSQIPKAVQGLGTYNGKSYALPQGTDGRVLFYNKKLFAQAGLPANWQPTSWQDILTAGAKLKALHGVTPIQIDAGTAMGEATTTQGVLPLLAGAGGQVYANGKWAGATRPLKDTLNFYHQIYSTGLGDPLLQEEADGRDKSFQEFAANKIGILAESDYLWRSVVNPDGGIDPMKDRNQTVGYALIPAETPGSGIRGQNFVSISGGSVWALNANTKYPSQAWDLLAFMSSAAATKSSLAGAVRITARKDVNNEVLASDPMLTFVADKVLPITAYRPPLAAYTQVSVALQQATAEVVSGKSADQAAADYQKALEGIVGAGNVSS